MTSSDGSAQAQSSMVTRYGLIAGTIVGAGASALVAVVHVGVGVTSGAANAWERAAAGTFLLASVLSVPLVVLIPVDRLPDAPLWATTTAVVLLPLVNAVVVFGSAGAVVDFGRAVSRRIRA